MNDVDLIPALFSFNTEHWVRVELGNISYIFKYVPLSIREKINISRRIEFEEQDKDKALNTKLVEFCRQMLRKAYGDEEVNVEDIPSSSLLKIYEAIVLDTARVKRDIEEYYLANKTEKLESPKHKPSKLDALMSICVSMKESNLTLSDLSDLDEVSLFCLMIYNDEMVTRESNAYHNAKAK